MKKRHETILDTVDDLMLDFLLYDRREDETLPVGAIQDAIRAREITVEEITDRVRHRLASAVNGEGKEPPAPEPVVATAAWPWDGLGGDKLKIEHRGTFRMQLVEMGGQVDDEGMTSVAFRCKVEEARRMAPMMYDWVEAKCTTASIVKESEKEQ